MRLFIAIELPEDIKKNIYEMINPLRREIQGIKWVEQNNLHLTLRFLGEVSEENASQIQTVLDQIIKQNEFKQFVVEFAGVGAFPSVHRPRVIWMGISEGADCLIKIAAALEESLEEIGIQKEDRPFSPHLTLGRVKEPKETIGFAEQAVKFDKTCFAGFSVAVVSLVQSFLNSSGPSYKRIFEAKLKVI